MVNVKDQTLSPLVDHADLLEHLPELDETDLSLTDAAADSAVPGLIFISAANLSEEIDYLFAYDRTAGELSLVQTIDRTAAGIFIDGFSSDHRWLILRSLGAASSSSIERREHVYLYDTQTQALHTHRLANNTVLINENLAADDEWLLFHGEGFLILSNPSADYDHLVPYSFADCTGAAWIKRKRNN
jgi:hypothetical protein